MARAFVRSWLVCRFSQSSGVVPKYCERRIAVSAVMSRRSRRISVTRLAGTPIAIASCLAVMPNCTRNSSRKISPGCVRMRGIAVSQSVIIDDFDMIGTFFGPGEAEAPMVTDAQAPLPGSIAFKPFMSIARWLAQIVDPASRLQIIELAPGYPCESEPIRFTIASYEQPSGFRATKPPDQLRLKHQLNIIRFTYHVLFLSSSRNDPCKAHP
jgi:hypothetical protein